MKLLENHRLPLLMTLITLMYVVFAKPVFAVSPVDYDAARDLFSYRGMFNSSAAFLDLYLESGRPSQSTTDKATQLIETLMNPSTFQKDLKLLRFQIRLSNDPAYREQFHKQLSLAYEYQIPIKAAFEFRNFKKSKVNLNAWNRNWPSGDLSYGIGFVAAVGASLISHIAGAGEVATFIAPVITLPSVGLLSRIALTHSGYTKASRQASWAENNLNEAIATMSSDVVRKVGLQDVPIPKRDKQQTRINHKANLQERTEVIKLASHSDGSPLIVLVKDLKEALDFRNDLPVYKGVESQLLESDGSQFYPVNGESSPKNSPLKPAILFSRILIPVSFRKAGGIDKTDTRQVLLLNALTHLLNDNQLILQPINTYTNMPFAAAARCSGLSYVADGNSHPPK